jgi:xanthine dehydrogenase accessory factor
VVDAGEPADINAEAAALGVTVATLDALASILRGAADAAVVVASQGHYDEAALEARLKSSAPYVGLVASRKRGAAVRALLEGSGVPRLATLRNPAGLDLGARTPQEVALSILAEIVQMLPSGTSALLPGRRPAPRCRRSCSSMTRKLRKPRDCWRSGRTGKAAARFNRACRICSGC